MSQLLATVGLPRSGKTTLLENAYTPMGYIRICPDDFRLAIHGQRYVQSAESFVWAAVYAAVDALLRAGKKVVVDACNGTIKRRQPWIDRGARFIIMGPNAEMCKKRAMACLSGDSTPEERQHAEITCSNIDRMARECDMPDAVCGLQLCTTCGVGIDDNGDRDCGACHAIRRAARCSVVEYLRPKDGPVVEGLETFETKIAENQPQYIPLRSLVSRDDRGLVLTRWDLTPEQRTAITGGADVLLELMTFRRGLQPIRIMVAKNPDAEQIRAEYNLQSPPLAGDEAALKATR